MKLFKYSEIHEMQDATAAVKSHNVIYLSSLYEKEELENTVLKRQSREKTIKLKIQLLRLDLLIQSRYTIWSELGANDELIECRKEIIEDDFLEEYKMTQEQLKKKYENKDTYTFEKNLAGETIEKSGIDVEYEKAKRIKEWLKAVDAEKEAMFSLPPENKKPNPELSTKVDILGFIKGRIFNFFNGVDDYAQTDTLDEDMIEPETLDEEPEEPIETLGV